MLFGCEINEKFNLLQMAKRINKFDFVLESLFVTDLHNCAHLNGNVPLTDLYMDYWQPAKLNYISFTIKVQYFKTYCVKFKTTSNSDEI